MTEPGAGVTGLGAVLGEIPAASAGMTDLGCADMMEVGCAGVTNSGAGVRVVGVGVTMVLCAARYPRQARV